MDGMKKWEVARLQRRAAAAKEREDAARQRRAQQKGLIDEKRAGRRAAGLCYECDQAVEPGRVRCRTHLSRQSANGRVNRVRRSRRTAPVHRTPLPVVGRPIRLDDDTWGAAVTDSAAAAHSGGVREGDVIWVQTKGGTRWTSLITEVVHYAPLYDDWGWVYRVIRLDDLKRSQSGLPPRPASAPPRPRPAVPVSQADLKVRPFPEVDRRMKQRGRAGRRRPWPGRHGPGDDGHAGPAA